MMVGLMISIVSGRAGEDYFVRAFSETSLEIPLAPGSGIYCQAWDLIAFDVWRFGREEDDFEAIEYSVWKLFLLTKINW